MPGGALGGDADTVAEVLVHDEAMVIGLDCHPSVSMVMGERRQEARGPASRAQRSPRPPDDIERAPKRDPARLRRAASHARDSSGGG